MESGPKALSALDKVKKPQGDTFSARVATPQIHPWERIRFGNRGMTRKITVKGGYGGTGLCEHRWCGSPCFSAGPCLEHRGGCAHCSFGDRGASSPPQAWGRS